MKKLTTILILNCLFSVHGIAQDSTKASVSVSYSPATKVKMNVTASLDDLANGDSFSQNLLINSYSFDIRGRYYLKNNLTCRLGIGYSSNIIKAFNHYSYSLDEFDEYEGDLSQHSFNITPSMERHLKLSNLELYTGAGIPLGLISRTKINGSYTYSQAGSNDVDRQSESILIPGGVEIGLQSFMGFNFYLFKNFAIGTEISYTVASSHIGGVVTNSYNDNGNISTNNWSENLKLSGRKPFPMKGGLNLTLNF